jgi:hypothetical protein
MARHPAQNVHEFSLDPGAFIPLKKSEWKHCSHFVRYDSAVRVVVLGGCQTDNGLKNKIMQTQSCRGSPPYKR